MTVTVDAGNPEWLDQDEQGEEEEVPEDGEEAAPRDSHVFFTTVRGTLLHHPRPRR